MYLRVVLTSLVLTSVSWAAAPPLEQLPPPKRAAPASADTTLLLPPLALNDAELMPIDLLAALRLADAANPVIAMARQRLTQALFRQKQAEVIGLPNLLTGPAYTRHDGLTQNQRGEIFPVSRWSFFEGGGAVLRLETGDAFFAPLIARRATRAQAAATQAVTNNLQLEVAKTYFDLVEVHGRLVINTETLANALEMQRNAEAAQEAGAGKTAADAPRARTEVQARKVERRNLEAQAAEVSAHLAQLLLLPPTVDLQPADTGLLPVVLVPLDGSLDELVAIGLQNRPEMAQAQALAATAQARWRQAQVDPLLPRLEVGYNSGYFGGGRNAGVEAFGGRGDGAALAVWELHNLGAGDWYRAKERRAAFQEAQFYTVDIQAKVGADITAAARGARARVQSLADAEKGVREAMETWRRLREAAFGLAGRDRRYDPLEPLIAMHQLSNARNNFLAEIVAFNKAQFRLYTAMGQPSLSALPQAVPLPLSLPVLPALPAKDKNPAP